MPSGLYRAFMLQWKNACPRLPRPCLPGRCYHGAERRPGGRTRHGRSAASATSASSAGGGTAVCRGWGGVLHHFNVQKHRLRSATDIGDLHKEKLWRSYLNQLHQKLDTFQSRYNQLNLIASGGGAPGGAVTLGLKWMVCVVIVVWGRLKKSEAEPPPTFFWNKFSYSSSLPNCWEPFFFQNWIGGGFDYGLQSKWWFWCLTTFFK